MKSLLVLSMLLSLPAMAQDFVCKGSGAIGNGEIRDLTVTYREKGEDGRPSFETVAVLEEANSYSSYGLKLNKVVVGTEGGVRFYGTESGSIRLYLLGDGTATYKRRYEAFGAEEKDKTIYATLECK